MGSPSPGATKLLKKETSTMMAVPHRRSPSVTSSCISLEIGDQDVQSPAKSNGLGKSSVTTTSSPRTPAGVPTEKSISPAAKKKRRSSIGGADDIARGLDFSPTASSVEEKKTRVSRKRRWHQEVCYTDEFTREKNDYDFTGKREACRECNVSVRSISKEVQ